MTISRILSSLRRFFLAPHVLLYWTLAGLLFPNIVLCHTEHLPLWAALANILLPLGIYGLIISASRKTGRQVWWLFPFIFMAAFNVVILFLFGNSIVGVDMFLNVVTTNPNEAIELLGNLLTGLATVIVLHGVPLVVGAIQHFCRCKATPRLVTGVRHASAAITVAGAACLTASQLTLPTYSALNDLFPLNVFYNVELAVERTIATSHYAETSAGFTFQAQPTHDDDERELYILVVGETVRAASMQLYGYPRPTTPKLSSHAKDIVAYTDVLSQSNTTHKSVPMILSAVEAENFDSIYHQRGIITAFHEAGFHTAFLSNQRPNHSFIDFFGEEADEVHFIKNDGKEHADAELMPLVRDIIGQEHAKQLIVMHLYGSHFNYRERYPDSLAAFMPDTPSEARLENRASLCNAYDNTLRALDDLLDKLCTLAADTVTATTLVYTSDHGENLYDDERHLFLHASPRPSYYELHVPLIIYTSQAYRDAHPEEAQALRTNADKPVASNSAVFHTMLQLAGISSPLRNDTLSLASKTYRCGQRFYLDDHNKAIPLQRYPFDPEDIEQFASRGIRLTPTD